MPEILFTPAHGEARKALHRALNAFLEPENIQLAKGVFRAQGPNWELAELSYTYHQSIYILRYSEEEQGNRLIACLDRHKIVESAFLRQYSNFADESQGLVFMDDYHEGEWAWQQAMREQNFPYLIQLDPEIAEEQEPAWNRCSSLYKSPAVDIRVCRSAVDFRVLCGTNQQADPCFQYVVSGLTNPDAIRRVLRKSPYQESPLHELVRLGQQSGWVYGWTWGAGPGEYHGTFWARDAAFSRQLATATGIRVLGHF